MLSSLPLLCFLFPHLLDFEKFEIYKASIHVTIKC